jgi:hypothetical protein
LIKVAVTVYLESEQALQLEMLSLHSRIPQQVYMREGVDLVLARFAKGKG